MWRYDHLDTSLVRITETVQCLMSVCKKPNTKGSRAILKTKQTFDCSPMVFKWCVYELGEFVHGKGNIWLSHLEMLDVTSQK